MWAGKDKQVTKMLKPGEETIVFKDSLTKVLLLDLAMDKPLKPNEPRYYWTWFACPQPPPSPVWAWNYQDKKAAKIYVDTTLQMAVRIEGKMCESRAVMLKVKRPERKE